MTGSAHFTADRGRKSRREQEFKVLFWLFFTFADHLLLIRSPDFPIYLECVRRRRTILAVSDTWGGFVFSQSQCRPASGGWVGTLIKRIRANSLHAYSPSFLFCFVSLFHIVNGFLTMAAAAGAAGSTFLVNDCLCIASCFRSIWLRASGQTCTFWGTRFNSSRSNWRKERRNWLYWRKRWGERRVPERRY